MPECISKGVEVVVLWDIAAIDIQHGVARLHLLATAVAGFFERQGYLLALKFQKHSVSQLTNIATQRVLVGHT